MDLDPTERPTISVDEAADVLGISRGSAYQAAHNGELPVIVIGRRLRVPTARLVAMLGLDQAAAEVS